MFYPLLRNQLHDRLDVKTHTQYVIRHCVCIYGRSPTEQFGVLRLAFCCFTIIWYSTCCSSTICCSVCVLSYILRFQIYGALLKYRKQCALHPHHIRCCDVFGHKGIFIEIALCRDVVFTYQIAVLIQFLSFHSKLIEMCYVISYLLVYHRLSSRQNLKSLYTKTRSVYYVEQ